MQKNSLVSSSQRTLRLFVVGLIVISTALFVLGVSIERSRGESAESSPTQQETGENRAAPTVPSNSGESAEANPDQGNAESSGGTSETGKAVETPPASTSTTAEAAGPGSSGEIVLGIDLENPWIIGAFVVVWIALLAGLFLLGRLGFVVVAVVSTMALIFDIAELSHQIGRSDALVAIIAALVAAGHATVATLAIVALMTANRRTAKQTA